ncbi:hypothetical protein VP01_2424g1 [Puccinia sorghi]|uniref:Uncharacterized protein n=1 Tax=Puccinia sorghi TaxID=27349 RepID=A0A0L6V6N0_9BASI|nr:hypothetical protein VP01_2424g1 [Puccinia sorghi]
MNHQAAYITHKPRHHNSCYVNTYTYSQSNTLSRFRNAIPVAKAESFKKKVKHTTGWFFSRKISQGQFQVSKATWPHSSPKEQTGLIIHFWEKTRSLQSIILVVISFQCCLLAIWKHLVDILCGECTPNASTSDFFSQEFDMQPTGFYEKHDLWYFPGSAKNGPLVMVLCFPRRAGDWQVADLDFQFWPLIVFGSEAAGSGGWRLDRLFWGEMAETFQIQGQKLTRKEFKFNKTFLIFLFYIMVLQYFCFLNTYSVVWNIVCVLCSVLRDLFCLRLQHILKIYFQFSTKPCIFLKPSLPCKHCFLLTENSSCLSHPQMVRSCGLTVHPYVLHCKPVIPVPFPPQIPWQGNFQKSFQQLHNHPQTARNHSCGFLVTSIGEMTVLKIFTPPPTVVNHHSHQQFKHVNLDPSRFQPTIHVDMPTSNNRVLFMCLKFSKNSFVHKGVTCQGCSVHPQKQRQHLSETQKEADKQLAQSLVQLTLEEFPGLVQPNHQILRSSPHENSKTNPIPSSDPNKI